MSKSQTAEQQPQTPSVPSSDISELRESVQVLLDLVKAQPPVQQTPPPPPPSEELKIMAAAVSEMAKQNKCAPPPDHSVEIEDISRKLASMDGALYRLENIVEKDNKKGEEKSWEDILRAAREDKDVSKEEYSRMALKYAEARRLEGKMQLGETISSTWNAGAWGKAVTVCSATGALFIAGIAWEGFATAIGWEGGKFIKKFSEWYAAA